MGWHLYKTSFTKQDFWNRTEVLGGELDSEHKISGCLDTQRESSDLELFQENLFPNNHSNTNPAISSEINKGIDRDADLSIRPLFCSAPDEGTGGELPTRHRFILASDPNFSKITANLNLELLPSPCNLYSHTEIAGDTEKGWQTALDNLIIYLVLPELPIAYSML